MTCSNFHCLEILSSFLPLLYGETIFVSYTGNHSIFTAFSSTCTKQFILQFLYQWDQSNSLTTTPSAQTIWSNEFQKLDKSLFYFYSIIFI